MKAGPLHLVPLQDFPAVAAGDSLGGLILSAITGQGLVPEPSSVVVIAQKVVSKAEGRLVCLDTVKVTPEARELASLWRRGAHAGHVRDWKRVGAVAACIASGGCEANANSNL